jgi:hypothetical protein
LWIIIKTKNIMNTGVLIKQNKTDWLASGETGILYQDLVSDWTPYLPPYEAQQKLTATQACATFSALNCIETSLLQQIRSGNLSDKELQSMIDIGLIKRRA